MAIGKAGIHLDATANLKAIDQATSKLRNVTKAARSSAGAQGAGIANGTNAATRSQQKYAAAQEQTSKNTRRAYQDNQRAIDQSRRQAYALSVAGFQAQALGRAAMDTAKAWVDSFAKIDYQARRAAAAFDMPAKGIDQTRQSVDMLIASSNDLARSFGMFDALTITEGLYFYASTTGATIKSQEELNKVMAQFTPILKAAGITSTGLETAIKGVNGIVNEFGMEMEEIPTIMAKLYSVTQKSAAELTDYFESFKMVGPIAKQMEASFDDVLILLSEFSDVQIKGGMAGRALRQTLAKMVAPAGVARKALDGLFSSTLGVGMTFDKVMKKGGSFVTFREYIDTLTKSLAQVSDAQREEILAIMTTQNEFAPLVETVNAGIESYREYGKSLFETSKYTEVLANATKDFEGDLETIGRSAQASSTRITASFEAIRIAMGNAMAPALADAADILEKFSRKFEAVLQSNKAIAGFVGGLMMFGGAILSVIGSLLIFSGTIALLAVGYRESRYMLEEFAKASAKRGSTIGKLSTVFDDIIKVNKWSVFFTKVSDGFTRLLKPIDRVSVALLRMIGLRDVRGGNFKGGLRTGAILKSGILRAEQSKPVQAVYNRIAPFTTNPGGYIANQVGRVTDRMRPAFDRVRAIRPMDRLQGAIERARAVQPSILRRGTDLVEKRPPVQRFYGAISARGTMTPSQAVPKAVMAQAGKAWEAYLNTGSKYMMRALEGGEKLLMKTIPKIGPALNNAWEAYIRIGGNLMIRGLERGEQILLSTSASINAAANAAKARILKVGPALDNFILNFYDATVGSIHRFNFAQTLEMIRAGLKDGLSRAQAAVQYFRGGGARRTIVSAFDSMQAGIKNFAAAARRQVSFVAEAIKPVLAGAGAAVKSAGGAAASGAKAAAGAAGGGLAAGAKAVLTGIFAAGKKLEPLFKKVIGYVTKLAGAGVKLIKGILSPIAIIFEVVIGFLMGLFKGFTGGMQEDTKKSADSFNLLGAAIEIIGAIIKPVIVAFEIIRKLFETLGILTAKLVQALMDLPIVGNIIKGVGDFVGGVGEAFGFVGEQIDSALGSWDKFNTEIANNIPQLTTEYEKNAAAIATMQAALDSQQYLPQSERQKLQTELDLLKKRNSEIQGFIDLIKQKQALEAGNISPILRGPGGRVIGGGKLGEAFAAAKAAKAEATGIYDTQEDAKTELEKALEVARQGADLKKAIAEVGKTNLEAIVKRSLGGIAKGVRLAVKIVAEISSDLSVTMQQEAADFAGHAEKVVAAIGAAASAFKGLGSVPVPGTAKIKAIVNAMNKIVTIFSSTMKVISTQAVANASVMAEPASQIVSAIGSVVDSFKSLSEKVTFQPKSYIKEFIANIRMTVKLFMSGMKDLKVSVVKKRGQLAEAVEAIVGSIASAVELFQSLKEGVYQPPKALIRQVMDSMVMAAKVFVVQSKKFVALAKMEKAAKFAEPVEAILGAFGAAASAFADMKDFVAPLPSVIDEIVKAIELTTRKIVDLDRRLGYTAATLEGVKLFSETASSVANAISSTYDAFVKTIDFVNQFTEEIDYNKVFGWIEIGLTRMNALSAKFSAPQMEQITAAANAAQAVAGAIQSFFDIAGAMLEDPSALGIAIEYAINTVIAGINQFNQGVSASGVNFVDQLILGMQSRESALEAEVGRLTQIMGTVGSSTTVGSNQKLEITHVIKDPDGALKNASASEIAAILSGDSFISNLQHSIKTQ